MASGSPTFNRIVTRQVPAFIDHFHGKNQDYTSSDLEPHRILGVRGQFADIWRKVWKLKKALWDGETLTGEQPREIIMDFIGHLFLTLDLLEQQETEPGPVVEPVPHGDRPYPVGLMVDAQEAVDGKPERLEKRGMLLWQEPDDTGFNCVADGPCSPGSHRFIAGCRFRIRVRRVS